MQEIPHICTDAELLIHCVAAKAIIDKYRAAAWPVKSFWSLMEELMVRCLAGGEEIVYKCLTFKKEEIVLPNGMSILYPNLRQEADKDDEKKAKRWVYGPEATPLYGGKITNNVVQGTARIVMTDGMLRVNKRYPVVGTVHDELIALVPDEEADSAQDWVLAQMTMEPSYLPGIPLAAGGGVHRRYGLAKD
jgi:DNA polymerase